MAKISNPRRISFHERDTLAFDFVGDPSAHGHGMEQNAAKKMAGTVWIDEADRQVARLEVTFYDNFRIGGGLLGSVQKGSTIEVQQSPIGDGLWMQTASEQHVAARIAVKSVRQNVHVKAFDFKKFDVDVFQRISPR
jgi:esterase/lipase